MAKRPMIHLLDTINGKYVYDANKMSILSISDELYNILDLRLKGKEPETISAKTQKRLTALEEDGYFQPSRVKKVEHPLTEHLDTVLGRTMTDVTLQVTQNCNLRCSYCIYSDVHNESQRSHSNRMMTKEVAFKALDFAKENSRDSDKMAVAFYGGEPLLAFPLIKEVCAYAHEIFADKELKFLITTNGTLLTEEIMDFLVKENFSLMISLDGPEKIHNKNRRFAKDGSGSYKTVMENMKKLKEKYPKYMDTVAVNSVIDPKNDFDTINSLYEDNEVFNVDNMQSNLIDDIFSISKIAFSADYLIKSQYQNFLSILNYLGRMDTKNVSPITIRSMRDLGSKINLVKNSAVLPETVAPSGPCVPGQSRLFVTVDGVLAPCERVNENSECMHIGDVDHGFNYVNIKKLLNVAQISENECKNCWAQLFCTSCCKFSDNNGELDAKFRLAQCPNMKATADDTLKKMILISEIKNVYGRN